MLSYVIATARPTDGLNPPPPTTSIIQTTNTLNRSTAGSSCTPTSSAPRCASPWYVGVGRQGVGAPFPLYAYIYIHPCVNVSIIHPFVYPCNATSSSPPPKTKQNTNPPPTPLSTTTPTGIRGPRRLGRAAPAHDLCHPGFCPAGLPVARQPRLARHGLRPPLRLPLLLRGCVDGAGFCWGWGGAQGQP